MAKSNLDRLAEQVAKSLAANSTSNVAMSASVDKSEIITIDQQSAYTPITSEPNAPAPPPPPAPPSLPTPSPAVANSTLADHSDMGAFLAGLSPEQLAKIRTMAAAKGLTPSILRTDIHGNTLVEIRIDRDLAEPLRAWAEQSGLSFTEQCQQIIDYLLPGFLIGGMGTPEMMPVAAAAAATT